MQLRYAAVLALCICGSHECVVPVSDVSSSLIAAAPNTAKTPSHCSYRPFFITIPVEPFMGLNSSFKFHLPLLLAICPDVLFFMPKRTVQIQFEHPVRPQSSLNFELSDDRFNRQRRSKTKFSTSQLHL